MPKNHLIHNTARLGIARVMAPHRYSVAALVSELRHLLDESYRARALAIREQLQDEDGVAAACDAIEGRRSRRTCYARGLIAKTFTLAA